MPTDTTPIYRYVVSLALSLLACACSSSLRYAPDYPLSTQHFRARDGVFNGSVPQGWSISSDDTLAPGLIVWLLRDDVEAALTIREITLDQLAVQQVKKRGLELLARITAGMQGEADSRVEPKSFELAGKKFCGYEISENAAKMRKVVFEAQGKYYECEAKPLKGTWSDEDTFLLFSIQQTVLSTLKF